MDIIHIKDLEVFAKHGVFKEENTLGQRFIVSAELYTDFSKAIINEDLDESIDYGKVSMLITEFMQNNTFKLIETVAVKLSYFLLLNLNHLKEVKIEIKKPWAPIGLPLDTASVEITRGWHTAFLSLGSNMGDKNKYIENAINALKSNEYIKLIKISPIYETEAYGGVEQDNFLNGCVEIKTILTPYELLDLLNKIEADNNRERILRWGPRTLDIDIIFYDNYVINTEALSIPHIDMHNRLFVLQPLNDIAPYIYHPIKNKTISELLTELKFLRNGD